VTKLESIGGKIFRSFEGDKPSSLDALAAKTGLKLAIRYDRSLYDKCLCAGRLRTIHGDQNRRSAHVRNFTCGPMGTLPVFPGMMDLAARIRVAQGGGGPRRYLAQAWGRSRDLGKTHNAAQAEYDGQAALD